MIASIVVPFIGQIFSVLMVYWWTGQRWLDPWVHRFITVPNTVLRLFL